MTVSAIVLAAGEGTRMRSDRPKPLHMICGRAMVLHVIHALEQLQPGAHRPRRRPRRRAGHQEGPGARAGVGQRRVRRAGRAARHRRRRGHRHDGVPRRRPRRRLDDRRAARRHAAAASRHARRARRHPRRQRQRGDAAHQRAGGPDRLRPGDHGARRTGAAHRRAARRQRTEERAMHEVCTSIYAFRRDLLGPALRHLSPDNAQGEFYLTDVVGVLGRDGPPRRAGRRRRPRRPRASTTAGSSRWPSASCGRGPTATGC